MHPLDTPIEVPQQMSLMGLFLVKDAPDYPMDAKSRHSEGSAIFDLVIGTDGRIISESLTNKVDPVLADAARQALTHWIYRPYLIDGLPVQVKTTITINFKIG